MNIATEKGHIYAIRVLKHLILAEGQKRLADGPMQIGTWTYTASENDMVFSPI